MKKMSSNKLLPLLTAALAALSLPSCETPEPADPREQLLGTQQYYNESLGFSIRYPGALNISVEDREGAGASNVFVKLSFPGNEQVMFRLATYDPAMGGHVRQYMIAGSERAQPVGGETGARFLVADQGSDEPDATLQHVTVTRDGKLYVMTGRGETFDGVVRDFEFIERPTVGGE
jgi:hypothetical protein